MPTNELLPGARKRRFTWRARAALLSCGLGFGLGCVLDSDDLCGPNQVIWGDDQRCICAEGFAYTPTGCVPCGENEVAGATGCVCAAGFARSTPEQACAEIPEGIGNPCTTNAECLNPDFPHCQIGASGGYCTTTGCATPAECEGNYACNTSEAQSYCQRPPVGAGTPCTMNADCEGTEALFCDNIVTFTCLVQGCNPATNDCFPGSECCDLTAFGWGTLCIAEGACTQ